MTEEQIEHAVERKFDGLDARLMAGTLTQEEYDKESAKISAWADRKYRFRRRA